MNKIAKVIITFVVLLVIAFLIPGSRAVINEYIFGIRRVDEQINYNNRKSVEDTARSVIVNYNTYRDEYELYKNYCEKPEDKSKCQRALDSKFLANQAAEQYNEYLQKNNYIFKWNLPQDTPVYLEKIDDKQ